MSDHVGEAASDEWRQHWSVVLASLFGTGLLTVYVYSTGIMIKPLEEEFGWSRAQISSGPTIVAVLGCLAAPFMGMAIDRFGARRIAIPGVIMLCSALALLSQANASIWSWWGLWFLVALAHPFIKPTVWVAAVSSVFAKGRGMALAVALCGTGIGSAVIPIMTTTLIDEFGWRLAYVGLGGIWLAVTLPFVAFGFYSATDKTRTNKSTTALAKPAAKLPGIEARPALRSARFVKLAIAASTIAMCSVAVTVNLVPIFSEASIDRQTGAAVAGVSGISGIFGKLLGGYLLDRLHAGRVVGVATAMPAISCALLILFPGSIPAAIAAVALLGFALGVEIDGVGYLTSRHFGLLNFGLIYGSIAGLIALTSGIGPVLANHAYDVTGSYLPLLWTVMPLSLMSAVLFAVLGPYPAFARTEDGDGADC
ncbi:MAG: MFS transporter [Novosphingobium sp.]|nr:MFS transporter [Novosphingobium sp.]